MPGQIDHGLKDDLVFRIVALSTATVNVAAAWLDGNVLLQEGVAATHPPPIRNLVMCGKFKAPGLGAIVILENKSVVRGRVCAQAADIGIVIEETGQREGPLIYGPKAIAQFVSDHFFGIKTYPAGQSPRQRRRGSGIQISIDTAGRADSSGNGAPERLTIVRQPC